MSPQRASSPRPRGSVPQRPCGHSRGNDFVIVGLLRRFGDLRELAPKTHAAALRVTRNTQDISMRWLPIGIRVIRVRRLARPHRPRWPALRRAVD